MSVKDQTFLTPEQFVDLLDGDTNAILWEEVLGEPWEDYVKPVKDKMAELLATNGEGNFDKNDILRDDFNRRAGPEGNRSVEGINAFYGDPQGVYARWVALGMGTDNVLENTYNSGVALLKNERGRNLAWGMVQNRFEDRPTRFLLDHGCGQMQISMAMLINDRDSFMVCYDHGIPARKLLAKAIDKYLPYSVNSRFLFCPVGEDDPFDLSDADQRARKYHYVYTADVLEHLVDPLGEIKKIHDAMVSNGVMYMGTFFDSCQGHDPQHLDEHKAYQDCEHWFTLVEEVGFNRAIADQPSAWKTFTKV